MPIINDDEMLTQELDDEITFHLPMTDLTPKATGLIQNGNPFTSLSQQHTVRCPSQRSWCEYLFPFNSPLEQVDSFVAEIGQMVSNMAGVLKDMVKEPQCFEITECKQPRLSK